MPVGVDVGSVKPRQWRWIKAAADVLVDLYHQDLQALMDGESWDDTHFSGDLPRRFNRHYDLRFAKQFLDVVMAVAWKIHDKGYWLLNSVAEELAMRAILNMAVVQAELEGGKFDPNDVFDAVFEDADFEWLLGSRWDGAEDDEEMAARLGVANLRFGEWFKPFRGQCYHSA